MQAVVEVPEFSWGQPPWPMLSMAAGSWLVLDGDCGDEQVGLFAAALALAIDVPAPGGRDEVVDALLAEELLIMAGGLRVCGADPTLVVVPGCCAGLEDWRDWTRVLTGESPWLGHDPGPEVERLGTRLRVWQDGGPGRRRGRWAGVQVDLPSAELPVLLAGVQRDLVGFLAAFAAWAGQLALGSRGMALTQAIDQHFAISAPLDVLIA